MSSDIVISLEALATMIKYDISISGKETAGLLIGHETDSQVHIDEVRIGSQKANAVHVEISTEELIEAAMEISEREDGKSIVGWIHTHPGLTAFLSPTDVNTQMNYQSLMPNAVAIVVDALRYSHTLNYEDLDFGVFRVVNGKAQRQQFSFKESVEFGLKSYIASSQPIQIDRPQKAPSNVLIPVVDTKQLKVMRTSVTRLLSSMSANDRTAIEAWIQLADAFQSGDYKEVPIDISSLNEKLDRSMEKIEESLMITEFLLENKRSTWVMILLFLGTLLNFFIFNFLL